MPKLLRLAILGEIGSRNLGDDLGYILVRDELISSLRRNGFEAHITYCTPARFGELDYADYEAVVTGLGTLLDECEGEYVRRLAKMQSRGVVTAVLGSGWSDNDHLPSTEPGRRLVSQVLSKCAPGTWVRGRNGPDTGWMLGWIEPMAPQHSLIGINMGYAAYTNADIEGIWSRLRTLFWALRSHGYPVALVSGWPNDNVWFKASLPEEPILQVDLSRDSLLGMSRIDTLVSFRGHLGVFASCAGVKVCSVEFSSKIRDMYSMTDVRRFPLETDGDKWFDTVVAAFHSKVNNKPAVEEAQAQVRAKISQFATEVAKVYG